MAFERWNKLVEQAKKDLEQKQMAAGQEQGKPKNKKREDKKHDRYNSRNGKPQRRKQANRA